MSLISKKMIKGGTRIRVLVVDDSVVIRRLVTMALEDDPLIEVVGVAANGAIALSKVEQLNPDLITLDIEMGEMDGLEMLVRLRKTYTLRDLRVIMFSTLTERGATATIDALWLGADDYVGKASNEGSLDRSMAKLRNELIPKIKQYFEFEQDERKVLPVAHRRGPLPYADSSNRSVEAVVIGVSTGGPKALAEIIPQFPDDYPLPVLIVQHMPAVFTRLLAERLQGKTRLKVEEAKDGDLVEPAKILIAPGDFHMRIRKCSGQACVRLDQGPALNSCRPAVDALFCSAEEVFGERTVAVMLTGMGHDGLRGTEVLKAHGALVIAQDEETSVVWGMPGAVVQAGLADEILPLAEIVPEIVRRTLPGVAA
jgi:two-component system chemotaxis response regulator CheB